MKWDDRLRNGPIVRDVGTKFKFYPYNEDDSARDVITLNTLTVRIHLQVVQQGVQSNNRFSIDITVLSEALPDFCERDFDTFFLLELLRAGP